MFSLIHKPGHFWSKKLSLSSNREPASISIFPNDKQKRSSQSQYGRTTNTEKSTTTSSTNDLTSTLYDDNNFNSNNDYYIYTGPTESEKDVNPPPLEEVIRNNSFSVLTEAKKTEGLLSLSMEKPQSSDSIATHTTEETYKPTKSNAVKSLVQRELAARRRISSGGSLSDLKNLHLSAASGSSGSAAALKPGGGTGHIKPTKKTPFDDTLTALKLKTADDIIDDFDDILGGQKAKVVGGIVVTKHGGAKNMAAGTGLRKPSRTTANAQSSASTEDRVASWAVSFDNLLKDPIGIKVFEDFLIKEYSDENIKFWKDCQKLTENSANCEKQGEHIYEQYIADNAPYPVNINDCSRQAIIDRFKAREDQPIENWRELFEIAETQIFNLMKYDSYARFIKSDAYKNCLLNELEKKTHIDTFTDKNKDASNKAADEFSKKWKANLFFTKTKLDNLLMGALSKGGNILMMPSDSSGEPTAKIREKLGEDNVKKRRQGIFEEGTQKSPTTAKPWATPIEILAEGGGSTLIAEESLETFPNTLTSSSTTKGANQRHYSFSEEQNKLGHALGPKPKGGPMHIPSSITPEPHMGKKAHHMKPPGESQKTTAHKAQQDQLSSTLHKVASTSALKDDLNNSNNLNKKHNAPSSPSTEFTGLDTFLLSYYTILDILGANKPIIDAIEESRALGKMGGGGTSPMFTIDRTIVHIFVTSGLTFTSTSTNNPNDDNRKQSIPQDKKHSNLPTNIPPSSESSNIIPSSNTKLENEDPNVIDTQTMPPMIKTKQIEFLIFPKKQYYSAGANKSLSNAKNANKSNPEALPDSISIKRMLTHLCRLKHLNFSAVDVYLTPAPVPSTSGRQTHNNTSNVPKRDTININEPFYTVLGKDLYVERRIIFEIELSMNGKCIGVKTKPNKTLGQVLDPILGYYKLNLVPDPTKEQPQEEKRDLLIYRKDDNSTLNPEDTIESVDKSIIVVSYESKPQSPTERQNMDISDTDQGDEESKKKSRKIASNRMNKRSSTSINNASIIPDGGGNSLTTNSNVSETSEHVKTTSISLQKTPQNSYCKTTIKKLSDAEQIKTSNNNQTQHLHHQHSHLETDHSNSKNINTIATQSKTSFNDGDQGECSDLIYKNVPTHLFRNTSETSHPAKNVNTIHIQTHHSVVTKNISNTHKKSTPVSENIKEEI